MTKLHAGSPSRLRTHWRRRMRVGSSSSAAQTRNCAEVARDYFPGCATTEKLAGHGLSDAVWWKSSMKLATKRVLTRFWKRSSSRLKSLELALVAHRADAPITWRGPAVPTSGASSSHTSTIGVLRLPISTASQIGSRNKATRCGTLFARRADHLGGILPLLIQHRPDHAGPSGGWDWSSVDNVRSKMTLGMTARHHGKLGPGRHVAMDASQDR